MPLLQRSLTGGVRAASANEIGGSSLANPPQRGAWKPRAVFFDFDGTLVDSYAAITASVNHVRAAHGLAPLSEAEVRRQVGRGPAYLLTHTVPGTDLEADLARYRQHHPGVLRSGTRLLPGAGAVIRVPHDAGSRLGVCSNKPVAFTRDLLEYLGLALRIEVVLGPEDVARSKPAPDMLQAALAQLGLGPADARYVGDMVVDIETARAAGVAVWVVATGSEDRSRLEAARPNQLLRDLGQIVELLGCRPVC
jgi:phosphoglycolate phosphatase